MFTDTHCHIFKEYYDSIPTILDKAQEKKVNRIINNGCNHKTNQEIIESINKYSNVYGAIGIHPEDVANFTFEDIKYIENNISNPKIIAIGEIGLDYHYTKENKEEQIKLFETQLKIAQKHHLPVIIHSREATKDTIDIISKYQVKGVIHSFSGSLETAQIYIKLGYLLGINGVITFKNSKLKEVIEAIPLENIILETDSPYLTPEPYRGKPNEPAHIYEIAQFICQIKKTNLKELSIITNQNIKRIFDI